MSFDPANPNQEPFQSSVPLNAQIDPTITCDLIIPIKNENGIRTSKIYVWKGIVISLIIFLVIEIIDVAISIFLLPNEEAFFPVKLVLCLILVPIFIPFLFVPIGIVCTFDYNNELFSCYRYTAVPFLNYKSCLEYKISLREIDNFFVYKFGLQTKKHYKIGIRRKDGQEDYLVSGQDHTFSMQFDPRIDQIEATLNHWLRKN